MLRKKHLTAVIGTCTKWGKQIMTQQEPIQNQTTWNMFGTIYVFYLKFKRIPTTRVGYGDNMGKHHQI